MFVGLAYLIKMFDLGNILLLNNMTLDKNECQKENQNANATNPN